MENKERQNSTDTAAREGTQKEPVKGGPAAEEPAAEVKSGAGRRYLGSRYPADYIRCRKGALCLYALTNITFVVVCALYQMNNMGRLLYAFLISTFFWLSAGAIDAGRYVAGRRRLDAVAEQLEQAAQVFAQEPSPGPAAGPSLEAAYESLISALCREQIRRQSEEERRRTERNDYYLLWAHQIKTPIAAMKLLLDGRDDGLQLTKELFKIEQYVEMTLYFLRLESISSDLLLKEYELYPLVCQTVKKFSVLFIGSRLSLKLEPFEAGALTDEKWLCFVIEQILSNSIKYTKTGSISIYVQGNGTLVIRDTGIGIRSEDLPRIFERGFTGYNGRMDKKSTGLGLYLCRQVMNMLGHGIRVESVEGVGTEVFLELGRKNRELRE